MPGFLDRLASQLGGTANPQDSQQALQMALLAAGIQTLGGAGTQGLGAIPGGLATGVDTFSSGLQQATTNRRQEAGLALDERSINLRENDADFERQLYADDKQRKLLAKQAAEDLWADRSSLAEALQGFRTGPMADDQTLQAISLVVEQAAASEDETTFKHSVEGFIGRLGDLAKKKDPRFFQTQEGVFAVGDAEGGGFDVETVIQNPARSDRPSGPGYLFSQYVDDAKKQYEVREPNPQTGELEVVGFDIDRAMDDYQQRFGTAPGTVPGSAELGPEDAIEAIMKTPGLNRNTVSALVTQFYGGQTTKTEDELGEFHDSVGGDEVFATELPALQTPAPVVSAASSAQSLTPGSVRAEAHRLFGKPLESLSNAQRRQLHSGTGAIDPRILALPSEVSARLLSVAKGLGRAEREDLILAVEAAFRSGGLDRALAVLGS